MKNILAYAVLFVFVAVSAATTQASAGFLQRSRIPPLIQQLNLSEDQKKKLEPVYEEQAKQLKVLKEDAKLSEDEKKAKQREINQATSKKLAEVLTPEQSQKLKELRKARAQETQKKP